ncbi:hypothetical protein ACVWW6_008797 [Bradyrhizobium sp. USDA 3311]
MVPLYDVMSGDIYPGVTPNLAMKFAGKDRGRGAAGGRQRPRLSGTALPVPAVIQLGLCSPGTLQAPGCPAQLRRSLQSRLSFLVGADVAKPVGILG